MRLVRGTGGFACLSGKLFVFLLTVKMFVVTWFLLFAFALWFLFRSFLLLLPFFLGSMQHRGFLVIPADSGLLKAFMDMFCMLFCAFEECLILLMCMVIGLVILYLFNFVAFFRT